jgi:hypothetical protein
MVPARAQVSGHSASIVKVNGGINFSIMKRRAMPSTLKREGSALWKVLSHESQDGVGLVALDIVFLILCLNSVICGGDGEICYYCSTCEGTGEIVSYDGNEIIVTCNRCGGSGQLCYTCPTCKGAGD